MTPDLSHIHPADDDMEPSAESRPGPSRQPVVSSSPAYGTAVFPKHPATTPAVSAASTASTVSTASTASTVSTVSTASAASAASVEAGVPAVPVATVLPVETETSAATEFPAEPEASATTEFPADPETLAAPEFRVGPEAPSAPEFRAEPEASVATEFPAGSEIPSATEFRAEPETPSAPEFRAEPETSTVTEPLASAGASPADPDPSVPDESGDEAVHTLLTTAATERPVEEVATLVARLQATGEVSSPADVALRAAAVTRPLEEVRQLLALLNASGYDLHQAETTLRAAAVGRSVEDVVQLVGILGADSSDWQSAGGGEGEPRKAEPEGAAPAAAAPKRGRGAAKGRKSPLDGALAAGPGSHTSSPALRSVLRWPAAVALFACGLIHLPTDLEGLRSGGDAQALSVVVTVLCLACSVWLAARDTLIAWAAAAGVAVFVIALHGVAGARTVDLLAGSLGTTFAWAKALALLSAVAVVCLACAAVVRHVRAANAADGT
ncbi:hypothetical protein [Streptomyces sp. NPDC002825]|uniref:hypothetical protein n=1 Tax=Streptomyces sp. NPDC002825 TaxID=3154666 RepID=UPI0033284846